MPNGKNIVRFRLEGIGPFADSILPLLKSAPPISLNISTFLQNPLQFHSRLSLIFRGQVGVTYGHFYITMAHQPADGVERGAHLDQPGGESVSKRMKNNFLPPVADAII